MHIQVFINGEPVTMHLVEPTDSQCMLGLLPGDRLMKVDGKIWKGVRRKKSLGRLSLQVS